MTDLTKDSHNPPIHGLAGGLKIHSRFWWLLNLCSLIWSGCLMQRLSLLLAPTKLVPLSDRMTITIKFFNIFLYFSEKPHQIIIISRKKVVIETNIWSTQDTSLPKFANIHIYNAIIQKLVNISFFVCLFFFFCWESISSFNDL